MRPTGVIVTGLLAMLTLGGPAMVHATQCVGDCNGNNQVAVSEITSAVNILLDTAPVSSCLAADENGDGLVTISEIVLAVDNLLYGCEVCPAGSPCEPGDTKVDACGRCGMQDFTCTSQCKWKTSGGCLNQGVCSPGQQQSQSCPGNCSTQSRACDGSCTWGQFGACSPSGPCSPGDHETSGCASGQERICMSNCQWSGCQCDPPTTSPVCSTCPSGTHVAGFVGPYCNSPCGGTGIQCVLSPSCAPNCGASFKVCGFTCPGGYYYQCGSQMQIDPGCSDGVPGDSHTSIVCGTTNPGFCQN